MGEAFDLGAFGVGLTLSSIGVFSIVNQALITPRIAKLWGELNTVYLSLVALFVCLLLLPLLPNDWWVGKVNFSFVLFMIVSYFINLSISLGMPSFKSLLTQHVDERRQGMITGLDESLLALGNSISPLAAGSMYTALGTLTFWFFAMLLFIPHLWVRFSTGKWRLPA